MKRATCSFFFILLGGVVFSGGSGHADTFSNAMSFQGYTGLFHTPNAYVADSDSLALGFSDHVEPDRPDSITAENYFVTMGMLPFVEFGGRLTEEHPEGLRDLSAHAKFAVPFFQRHKYWPEMAVGIQDFGGGASHFETTYAVLSKEIWPLRLSLGYGVGPDRLDGPFGGMEIYVFNWLSLMGEYDTDSSRVGSRVTVPDIFFQTRARLNLCLQTDLDRTEDDLEFLVSLRFPLGQDDQVPDAAPKTSRPSKGGPVPLGLPPSPLPSPELAGGDPPNSGKMPVENAGLAAILRRLGKLGFENLVLGVSDKGTLHLEYENNRFNHNELDGLGIVLGVAATLAPPNIKHCRVILKNADLPILSVTALLQAYRVFLQNPDLSPGFQYKVASHLEIAPAPATIHRDGLELIAGDERAARLKPRVIIKPGLQTFIGTEVDLFDYELTVDPELRVPLWKGGVLAAEWRLPMTHSENFDDRRTFERERERTHLEQLLLHQALKWTPTLMTLLSMGTVREDTQGVIGESVWMPGDGDHRFKLHWGHFSEDGDRKRDTFLGSYRYHLPRLDLQCKGTYGRYWAGDTGMTLEMARFFRDIRISLYYKQVGTADGERAGGIRFSLPLTPRKDMRPGLFQVRGTPRWEHQIQTTLNREGTGNVINTNVAVIPRTALNIEDAFLNSDRLSAAYVRANIRRLRASFIKYGTNDNRRP